MRLRRPDTNAEPGADTPPPGEMVTGSPLGRWWMPKVIATGLWLVIAAAVVFAGLAWARPVASSTPPPVLLGEEARWDVAGFAELFVAQFVDAGDGDETLLAPFLSGQAPFALTGADSGGWFASSTTTTAMVGTGRDRWKVTVAAGLLRRDGESTSYVSLGVRFFEVEVVATDSGLAAVSLPWIAPAPHVGDQVGDDWGRPDIPESGDPLADTTERFLTALLTGNGELGRYAAPGSDLRAVPATFDTVDLDRLASRTDADGGRWVRAWVKAESADSLLWLTYDLQVAERDGRWEIAAMGPEPVVNETPEIPVTSTTIPVAENTTQGS